VASLTLLLGVDRFMSEARAITNLIGNGIATLVVAKWENALDERKLQAVLSGTDDEYADDPEDMLILEESAETAPVATPK
jgi:aerobic C4-dicarboxylate transport protein